MYHHYWSFIFQTFLAVPSFERVVQNRSNCHVCFTFRCTQRVYFYLDRDDANGWKYTPVTHELRIFFLFLFLFYRRIIWKNVFVRTVWKLRSGIVETLVSIVYRLKKVRFSICNLFRCWLKIVIQVRWRFFTILC